MTQKGLGDVTVVLDRSGSMEQVKSDTIGGFNKFVEDQKKLGMEINFTLTQFDDIYEVVYSGVNIKDVRPLDDNTFVPRNWTALLDAIGRTIEETGRRFSLLKEEQRPETVILVILTDGFENASKKFDLNRIQEMIKLQTEVYKWQFIFLGANQDAIQVASQMGISGGSALNFAANSTGTKRAFASLSSNVGERLTSGGIVTDFSEEDRQAQRDAGATS